MKSFIDQRSIVRTIWGNPDLILLIFAGSAAEFALNRAVDWLFFTGKIPNDPIGRLFSTVRYAQQIVFVDEETAQRTLNRINAMHGSVERERGKTIPEWAYRDVLYMLIDYSERAYRLLYRSLTPTEKKDLYSVFRRIGEELHVQKLPPDYEEWIHDRTLHLEKDLVYSRHTHLLYQQYQRHLGLWRYCLLLQVQGLLVPERVGRLLKLSPNALLHQLVRTYGIVERCNLQSVVHTLLIPPRYWQDVRKFDRVLAA
jgi:uncharacterized protein (DUF2236 family)